MSDTPITGLLLLLAACSEGAAPSASPALAPTPESHRPVPAPGAAAAPTAGAEACADAWLAAHRLNRFGDAEDTQYAGGTPLFNERTGATVDRLQFLVTKLPALRAACGAGDGG